MFILQRVLAHQEEQALLKAYIAEWRKFFTQCNYLPTPFKQLEISLVGKTGNSVLKKNQADESIVRKVRRLPGILDPSKNNRRDIKARRTILYLQGAGMHILICILFFISFYSVFLYEQFF